MLRVKWRDNVEIEGKPRAVSPEERFHQRQRRYSKEELARRGFTGFLSFPISIVTELELSWSYRDRATLGDGSEVLFDIYDGMVIWGGQYREIEINAAETEPLIGMSMLRGYRLQVDTIQGGLVAIAELSIVV